MAQLEPESPVVRAIDEAIARWRQGDFTLEETWFAHVGDPERALTPESGQLAGGRQAIISEVKGVVLLTQSCDIVRSCAERPFVEVAPLVAVDAARVREIERLRRPRYAFVPALGDQGLVADLDRVMTIEKAILADWQPSTGCRSADESRAFSLALARKRCRFAFPNDFTILASKLQERLSGKHDRQSDEGRALRSLREIRVRAAPSWLDPEIDVHFWFIREEGAEEFEGNTWDAMLAKWLSIVPPAGRFVRVDGTIVELEDLTAKDFVESDPLDLDQLSAAKT